MPRLTPLNDSELSAEQRGLRDKIVHGPRGKFGGPFPIWLRSPGALAGAEALGTHLRFACALPGPLKEVAVLIAARHWRCEYEWAAHVRHAHDAGVPPAVIAAIARNEAPPDADAAERAVHDFMRQLLSSGRVSSDVYQTIVEILGADQVVELVMLTGYYTLIAMTLNTFEVPADPVASIPMAG